MLQLSFEGPDLDTIAHRAKAWADQYLGSARPEDLLRKKVLELVYGIGEGSRRVLGAMVDLALAGKVPTPPLVMTELKTKAGDEQGVRAVIGKVRAKVDALDRSLGGPMLLEKAPFIDGHTQYHFGRSAAAEIRRVLDDLDTTVASISAK